MEPYVLLEKKVGETPLSCTEKWRTTRPDLVGIPLSYAGRLDPMASGKLLVLLGEECKRQADYHDLDKEYEFSVLFGISSDTGDVLGRLTPSEKPPAVADINHAILGNITQKLTGEVTFPYPLFSAKTVSGKPLHMWTLEGRLGEITIPQRTSTIFNLTCTSISTLSRDKLIRSALEKIDTIPLVTDPRKALGQDFRRVDIRQDWRDVELQAWLPPTCIIATFTCTASSGTYMRTLAKEIAIAAGTSGLAWHIHRTKIGTFNAKNNTWARLF